MGIIKEIRRVLDTHTPPRCKAIDGWGWKYEFVCVCVFVC
jgi:hypothetical protein